MVEKISNGVVTTARAVKEGGVLVVSLLVLGLGVWLTVTAHSAAPPFTKADGDAMERRLGARIDKLEDVLEGHLTLDAHVGAGRTLAALTATLESIQTNMTRIERRVDEPK